MIQREHMLILEANTALHAANVQLKKENDQLKKENAQLHSNAVFAESVLA